MKRRITVFALAVVAVVAVLATAAPAQAAPARPRTTSFMAFLNGHNQTPVVDADATGIALLRLKANRQLCWVIFTHRVDGMPNAAHIHAVKTGDVVVPLSVWPGCTWVSRDVARALRDHPDQYYVNVHSTAHPDGALRGMLVKAGSSH